MFFFHSSFRIFVLSFGWMETRHLGKRCILGWVTNVRVFRKNCSRFCPKNARRLSTDKRSMMFWGPIRSDGKKMLVKCPALLNSSVYLEILKSQNGGSTFELTGHGVSGRQRPSTEK